MIIMKVGMNGMQLLERSEGNTVVSPLSLFTSLSMASLGAKGLTLDEIHRTLHLSPEALSRMGGIIASFQVFESAAIQFAIIQPNHQMFPTLRYTPINKKLFFLIASFHPSQPPNHPTTQLSILQDNCKPLRFTIEIDGARTVRVDLLDDSVQLFRRQIVVQGAQDLPQT